MKKLLDVVHTVTIILDINGATSPFKSETINDGDSFTIKAPEEEGYTFVKMTIEGDFEEATRMKKEYTVPEVTITPKGDINVVIYYSGSGSNAGGDSGNTSPDTGVDFTLVILATVLGLFGAAIATKKLFEK